MIIEIDPNEIFVAKDAKIIRKKKILALFFSWGVSIEEWDRLGIIDRELKYYNILAPYFEKIFIFTYGPNDGRFRNHLEKNIIIIERMRYVNNNLIYSIILPIVNYKILRHVDTLKTHQILGAWSAIIAKKIYRKKLIIRAGWVVSSNLKKQGAKKWKLLLMNIIERVTYANADIIISSSQKNFEYVNQQYRISCPHYIIPNYVDTSLFKPSNVEKVKGSICFVGRLEEVKNLTSLFKALHGLPYSLTLIGNGSQKDFLSKIAKEDNLSITFLGNIPNSELPGVINRHEIFILPSLWEGMPKALLESMSCGMPIIGTNVNGINEVIVDGQNGILCEIDADSIKRAIINLMENEALRKMIGQNARVTVLMKYSLEKVTHYEMQIIHNM